MAINVIPDMLSYCSARFIETPFIQKDTFIPLFKDFLQLTKPQKIVIKNFF
jgi:hypothetical protein